MKRNSPSAPDEPTPSKDGGFPGYSYCAIPEVRERSLPADLSNVRVSLIRTLADKWVNGTVLHYYFFDKDTDGRNVLFTDGTTEWRSWTTTKQEMDVVRRAFTAWKNIGIGLKFVEVSQRSEAEIRIGFERGDGAWSYIGRQILDYGLNDRTMNFGWNLLRDASEIDTAIHEIGHTLGFPHEHQNPFAGIEWDEEKVYASLAKPPNEWKRDKTYYNIIRKIPAGEVKGSGWDPDSIMEYPFEAGLIKKPDKYVNGLQPAGGLSAFDKTWTLKFYPPLSAADHAALKPFESIDLNVEAGQQRNFNIEPSETRVYQMKTFGDSDAVMVLFENVNGDYRYVAGEDDSGEARNAELSAKLFAGRKYVLRVRLYSQQSSKTAVMLW